MDANSHFSRPKFLRLIIARPRLLLGVLLGLAMVLFLPESLIPQGATRLLLGWNAGAILYLLLALRLMFWSTHDRIRYQALIQDEGRIMVLVFVVMAAFMCLGAIVALIGSAKDLTGPLRQGHIALGVLTIFTSWAFTHVMFALHYAHDYYLAEMRKTPPGLEFPGDQAPDYGDFLYFSCVIGTSGQTADVCFSNRAMRRTGLLHCVLAFFFNTTLLALTINLVSGLF